MDESLPPLRIGDAERDQAAELLREHLTAGRLTHGEFDERLGQALTARTQGELDALFLDLPGSGAGQRQSPEPADPRGATDLAPLQWDDQPDPPMSTPWWTHWGLFVMTIVLASVSSGRLGVLIPFMAVWVFWLGPQVAAAQHQHRVESERRRRDELGR